MDSITGRAAAVFPISVLLSTAVLVSTVFALPLAATASAAVYVTICLIHIGMLIATGLLVAYTVTRRVGAPPIMAGGTMAIPIAWMFVLAVFVRVSGIEDPLLVCICLLAQAAVVGTGIALLVSRDRRKAA